MNEPKLVIVDLAKMNEAFAMASENLKPLTGGLVMRMLQASIVGPYEPQETKEQDGKSE